MKKFPLFAILLVALVAPGCSWFKYHRTPKSSPNTIVTPDMSLAAKVVSVDTVGRFVILSFPEGKMPKVDQTMFLYRAGMKVAEVKVTGPQQENNIVADLVSGDPQVGDMVRAD
jgi:hypothetical protein